MLRGKKQGLAHQRSLGAIIGCLWLGGIATGMVLLAWHEGAPGVAATAPHRWPQDSRIPLNDHGATLLMFAHPRCPCTRASLGELEKIVSRYPGEMSAWAVFIEPSGADETWAETDQLATAGALPGVQVLRDVDGDEIRRFHAATSGQTLLYDRAGELQFSGGITMSRGHAGDNAGRSAIELLLSGAKPEERTAPVFGCSLQDFRERD